MRRFYHQPRMCTAIVLLTMMSWLMATFWPDDAIRGVDAHEAALPTPSSSAATDPRALASATPTGLMPNPIPVRHADAAIAAASVAVAPQSIVQPTGHLSVTPATVPPQVVPTPHSVAPTVRASPNPQPGFHPVAPTPPCTGYGDGAYDRNGISVDVWASGIRNACGYIGYENGDDPMPPGTPFPPPRPFRSIDPMEPVFGFKVFYLNAGSPTPCNQLRIIFHQGDAPGGRGVQFHSMQYTIAHCDSNGNYLGYTDVAAFADTGGVMDVNPAMPNGDNGTRPMKLVPTLADVVPPLRLVFEVWYVDFLIYAPGSGNTPAVTVRPGFDILNVSAYHTMGDFTSVNFTCSVSGLGGGVPGEPSCQYDGAKRGLSHPDVLINNQGGAADYCTDLYGNNPSFICDATRPLHQHVFTGPSLDRQTCAEDGGVGAVPDCYPEFVLGPNAPRANKSSTPYESPGPATYAAPGLVHPN